MLRFLSSRLLVYSLVLLVYLRLNWVKTGRGSLAGLVKTLGFPQGAGRAKDRS